MEGDAGEIVDTERAEIVEREAVSAKEYLRRSIALYDDLFIEVHPVDRYNDPCKGLKDKIPYPVLTGKQTHILKELAGCLSKCRKHIASILKPTEPGAQPHKMQLEAEQRFVTAEKARVLMRDLLMAEICRIDLTNGKLDRAETALMEKDTQIEKLEKENKRLKAARVRGGGGGNVEQEDAALDMKEVEEKTAEEKERIRQISAIMNEDPRFFLHRVICKKFNDAEYFGVVVNYGAGEDEEDEEVVEEKKSFQVSLYYRVYCVCCVCYVLCAVCAACTVCPVSAVCAVRAVDCMCCMCCVCCVLCTVYPFNHLFPFNLLSPVPLAPCSHVPMFPCSPARLGDVRGRGYGRLRPRRPREDALREVRPWGSAQEYAEARV
jgi:hypothetical protein